MGGFSHVLAFLKNNGVTDDIFPLIYSVRNYNDLVRSDILKRFELHR